MTVVRTRHRDTAGNSRSPPAPPATIADTGLHRDTLSQLMLKTWSGEARARPAEALRLSTRCSTR
jgi:hypothetical protein